jgi:8-oxo-dGTP pyrophosphatase MutT (NUDIX family)
VNALAAVGAPGTLGHVVTAAQPAELARVVATLEALDVADAGQERLRTRMLAFAADHPDALLRSCPEGHFTASALVVDAAHAEVLVLFHAKLRKWLQPGGHVDGSGDLASSARREATEETGIDGLTVVGPAIDLDIHEVCPPREAPHLHLDVRYVVEAPPGATVAGNHESTELRWVSLTDLDGLGADEGLRRLAARGLDRVRSGAVS